MKERPHIRLRKQHRLRQPVGAADRRPLIDPAETYLLQSLDAIGCYDLTRVGDDRSRFGTAGWFDWLLPPDRCCDEHGEKGDRLPVSLMRAPNWLG
jgi:hypothetical protein